MRIKSLLMMLALGVFSSSASAAMVFVGVYEGNDPAGDTSLVSDAAGTTLFHEDRVNWDDALEGPQSSGALTITGTTFKEGEFFEDGITPKYEITAFEWNIAEAADYITFKADGWLILYQLTDGTMSGDLDLAVLAAAEDCCTNDNGIVFALSHSTTYNAVPVPAALWLFASGLIGLVGVARKKA